MNEIESMRYFQDLYDRFADKPGEVYWARVHNQITREAIETALVALREKQERSKGCEHCLLGLEIAYKAKSKDINSKESYICLDGNYLEADFYTEYMAVEVRYCPMCGRRLEEQQ